MKPQEPRIQMLSLRKLIPFPNHPFQIRDDADMKLLEQSIIEQGVLHPIIVRPSSNDNYEIISGHRRVYACNRIGVDEIPAQVVNMDQNAAEIAMVDSNLQREHILPSEKAYAYAIKLNAMKRQGKRPTTNPHAKGERWSAACILGDEYGESEANIRRYVRLTHLIPEILRKVDEGNISLTPALELSSLTQDEQKDLLECMEANDCTPSLSQTVQMRKLSRRKELTSEKMETIMEEPKANQREKIAFKVQDLRCFFPDSFSAIDIQKAIIELLTNYQRGESTSIPDSGKDNSEEIKKEGALNTVVNRQKSQTASLPGRCVIDEKKIMNMKDTVLCAQENGIALSEYTLRRAMLGGRIPYRRVGRKYMIMWGNVLDWLNCEDGGDADRIEDDYLDNLPRKIKGDSRKISLLG